MTGEAKKPAQIDSWDKEIEERLRRLKLITEAQSKDAGFIPSKINETFQLITSGDDFTAGFLLTALLDIVDDRTKSAFSDAHEREALFAIRDKINLWYVRGKTTGGDTNNSLLKDYPGLAGWTPENLNAFAEKYTGTDRRALGVAARRLAGEKSAVLAAEFCVSEKTIQTWTHKAEDTISETSATASVE